MPYVLKVCVSKSEDDLEGVFLKSGGTLGTASARSNTQFSLTHSDVHSSKLVTDKITELTMPLSEKLIASSLAEFEAETGANSVASLDGREVLLLSERTQLLVAGQRKCAAIDGTAVVALGGSAATPLSTLFSTVDATNVTEEHPARPTRERVPYRQLALKYQNWENIAACVTFADPAVFRVHEDGSQTQVSVAFFVPVAKSMRIAAAEPVLKKIYDDSWATAERVAGVIPNLTKSVMSVSFGINGSGFLLAAAANDAPASTTAEVYEQVFKAALKVDDVNGSHDAILIELAQPNFTAALKHGERIATTLSCATAFSMPYRVDSMVTISPTGLKTEQSESWKFSADAVYGLSADDCEGSARASQAIINEANRLFDSGANMSHYPALRALRNWSQHNVTGLTVMAANAGNASAANENATTLAGHCVLSCVGKYEFIRARAAALAAAVGTGEKALPKVSTQQAKDVRDATFAALYPTSLVQEMPEAQRAAFQSFDALAHLHSKLPEADRDEPLIVEGTAFANARVFTRNAETRNERLEFARDAKTTAARFEPNIARASKVLDVGEQQKHSFYERVEEISVGIKHPLFTNARLRELGAATCSFRFAQIASTLVESGATPAQLANREFALTPLFALETTEAATIDEALEEALANAMPRAGGPIILSEQQEHNLDASLDSLTELALTLDARGETVGVGIPSILSYASLVNNPSSVKAFCDSLIADETVKGMVFGEDRKIFGVAQNAEGEELGRLVSVEVAC